MSEKLFGTDGVRGIPGEGPLTAENIARIAELAARVLLRRLGRSLNGTIPPVLLGRDTRGSGPSIARAVSAGLAREGVRTIDLGVLPTPGISYLVGRERALGGVVVSASHNPAQFNGVKFFASTGKKLDDAGEAEIEREFSKTRSRRKVPPALSARAEDGRERVRRYLDFLRSTFPATESLEGSRLVLDCANGAAWALAPELFAGLGAEAVPFHCSPNGKNINENCGALFAQGLRGEIIRRKAGGGVCFDGDADRAILLDETGKVLDGDHMICAAALEMKKEGLLAGNKVVLTVMSNYGAIQFLAKHGIAAEIVPVGDRNVSEALERGGLSLGGEPSGHLIFSRFAATGDGMLTALQVLAGAKKSGHPLSALRKLYSPLPQLIHNVPSRNKVPLERLPGFSSLLRRGERGLAGRGRILIRYSGTEPILRIMVEGPKLVEIRRLAESLGASYLKESRSHS